MPEVVDIHAHAVLEGLLGHAGSYGPELVEGDDPHFRAGGHVLRGVQYRGTPFMDPDVRLERMEEAGIDRQVLSPNPLYYFHHVESEVAVDFSRRHNDLMAELVSRHERLDGTALLPLQAPDRAVRELHRSICELGLVGAYVGTRTTRELDDPAFDPLWSEFVRLGVPVFLHPAPDAVDAPVRDPRMRRWDLDLLLGFAHDETIAVATLIFGGVIRRHPKLNVCISHGGGATPFLYGRMAAAARTRPWAPDWLSEEGAFEGYLRRLWFDCHVHDPRALRMLTDLVGMDRIVLGTNFGGWDQGGQAAIVASAPAVYENTRRLLNMT